MYCTFRFIIFSCVFVLCSTSSDKMLGPGEVIFQSFENCDPPVKELNLSVIQRKYNRTTNVIDMTVSSPWELSDDIILEVKCEVKGDGGYKPGSFYLKGPFCSTFQSLIGDLFYAILEAFGVDSCPIPGEAKIGEFFLDSKKLNDQLLYGERRAILNFYVNDEVKGCYMLYLNLIPTED